jgi:hypothetical protein
MIDVGSNEFDRINSQYRRLTAQLDEGGIRTAAVEELTEECRRESRYLTGKDAAGCSSWSPAAVGTKARIIEKRRLRARDRGTVKLVLFYAFYVVIFLLGPPILVYLLIIAILALYRNIRFVRE